MNKLTLRGLSMFHSFPKLMVLLSATSSNTLNCIQHSKEVHRVKHRSLSFDSNHVKQHGLSSSLPITDQDQLSTTVMDLQIASSDQDSTTVTRGLLTCIGVF